MKSQKVIFLLLVLTIALTIFLTTGVGYATTGSNTLKFHDEILITPDQGNFKVEFIGETSQRGNGNADIKITGKTTAIMNITGLKKAGDEITVTFNIKNTSNDLNALLRRSVQNSNPEYFRVTAFLGENAIGPKNRKTELNIKVKLIKTPILKEETANICVKVEAIPETYKY